MKIVRSISAVIFALLVLLSSTNFMIGMHFCMGEVQSVSLFSKADGCEREKNVPPCHRHVQKPCCADETVIHDADDFSASGEQLQIIPQVPFDIEQPLVLVAEIIPSAPVLGTPYCNYDPPLRSCDLTVALQVFLI